MLQSEKNYVKLFDKLFANDQIIEFCWYKIKRMSLPMIKTLNFVGI